MRRVYSEDRRHRSGHREGVREARTGRRVQSRAVRHAVSAHFQSRYFSRNAVFRNLPVEVRGMESVKTYASGTIHFTNFWARKALMSASLACMLGLSTITASGRSDHFG